ncbi:unnamed protein product [Urochloa humidicola]
MLVHSRFEDSPDAIYMTVQLQGKDSIKCTCGLYEHLGVLCCHAIKVLCNLDRKEIPSSNILKRWTKVYDNDNANQQYIQHLAAANDDMKRTMLINTALQLSSTRGKISNSTYMNTMASIKNAMTFEDSAETNAQECIEITENSSNPIPTSWPPSTYRGGRPSIKRQRLQSKDEAQKGSS